MRTTVTLDADVEQRLRTAMQRQGTSFKQALNDALRRGLGDSDANGEQEEPFRVEARPLGLRAGVDPAHLRDVDDDLEIESFREKAARLAQRRT